MICSKLEELVHIGCNKVDTQTFRVFCVCGTAGDAKSIGLGEVGQKEKYVRLVKEILCTFL